MKLTLRKKQELIILTRISKLRVSRPEMDALLTDVERQIQSQQGDETHIVLTENYPVNQFTELFGRLNAIQIHL